MTKSENNGRFLLKFFLLLIFSNISVFAWYVSNKEIRQNVSRTFYVVDKKVNEYAKNRSYTHSGDDLGQYYRKRCKMLEKSSSFFVKNSGIKDPELKEIHEESLKSHKLNSSRSADDYFFSNIRTRVSNVFSSSFTSFPRIKIKEEDVENIIFHKMDLTKNIWQDLYSLDNEYDVNNHSTKNVFKFALIQSAIGLASYKLLLNECREHGGYDIRDAFKVGQQIPLIEF